MNKSDLMGRFAFDGAELARGTLDEVRSFKTIDIERRQPAGPWLPVEGESGRTGGRL